MILYDAPFREDAHREPFENPTLTRNIVQDGIPLG
jgi:hypothetical protein